MSYILWDEDLYEPVSHYTPCSCGGLKHCNGMCNGSASTGWRARSPEAVAAIKAKKLHDREERVLAEAAQIQARRA